MRGGKTMKYKAPRVTAFDFLNIVFMVLIIAVCIYPVIFIISASLSSSSYMLTQTGLMLFPKGFNLSAYKMVFKNANIMHSYGNTIFVVVVGTALNIVATSVAAFLISRKNFMLRKPLTLMIVFTMYFSGGIIPTYLVINNFLHLSNNLMALILPKLIIATNLFVMRTYFMSIPDSLLEAARIDGASEVTVLFRIIMPLSMPVIAVMLLYYGVEHWNSWFDAMLYIHKRDLYPLQLILREIVLSNSTSNMMSTVAIDDSNAVGETIKYATMVVATVPILCVYPFLQRFFVKGITAGAVKE
jgi:putative aldouronate transport system permease protein